MNTHTSTARPRALAGPTAGLFAAVGIAAAALFGTAAPAHAHDQLIDAAIEQAENGEATGLRFTYSNNVLDMGTEVLVTDAAGTDVSKGAPKVSGRDVTIGLDAPLADGAYSTVWRVVSSDGHPIDGGFSFDIEGGEPSPLRALEGDSGVATDHEHDHADEDHAHDHGHEHDDEHAHDHDDTALTTTSADADGGPNFTIIGPLLGVGAGLAAIVILTAIIVRARKNAAARGTAQNPSKQE